jgi:hypothetical protein
MTWFLCWACFVGGILVGMFFREVEDLLSEDAPND